MNRIEEAELQMLFALVVEYNSSQNSFADVEELYEKFQFRFDRNLVRSLPTPWERAGLIKVSRSLSGKASAIVDLAQYAEALKIVTNWLGVEEISISARKEEIISDRMPEIMPPLPDGWKWFSTKETTEQPKIISGNAPRFPQASTALTSVELEIPASDRIVSVDHNSTEVQEIKAAVDELVRKIRFGNDLGDLSEEEAIVAANEVYRIGTFFDDNIVRQNTVMTTAKITLAWISDKAGGAIVGILAIGLLSMLASFFGIPVSF
jgi:hypothetical protein